MDVLLDDPAFFAPFAPALPPICKAVDFPEFVFLRLMFLKFRYRLGYESLCAEVSDSISWRRFCRIPLDGKVATDDADKADHPVREGGGGRAERGAAAKAAGVKLLRTARVRADTTVIAANVAYPTERGCWPGRWASWCGRRGGCRRQAGPPGR